jgi:F1F0 ATPase subunit 2
VSDALSLLASLTAGALLGCVFFWGLWLTIAGLDRAEHPARRVLTSVVLRFGLVLLAFLLFARLGGWEHVVAAAIGFALSRFLVIRGTRPRALSSLNKESDT